jgi:GAF domain-containing protein
MESETREGRLAAAFVTLADTLVADYDVAELLQRLVDTCAELLSATAAGLLLTTDSATLEVIASTSEQSRLVDLMQVKAGAGPSLECVATGHPVSVGDVSTVTDAWSSFRDEALAQGFHSAHAYPLRLRGTVIGTLTLLRTESGVFSAEDSSVAQGLADVATIGILHERALRESDVVQKQLQHALNSRVVIEQAKGVVAQIRGVDMDEAFRLMREFARGNNRGLRSIAEAIVSRDLQF